MSIPEILHHGTSLGNWKAIQTTGEIRARGLRDGNWSHTVVSNPDCIYLTTCYAPYFALNAVVGLEPWVIVEIDTGTLHEDLFLPDEDVLEQMSRGVDVEFMPTDVQVADMKTRTEWFRKNINAFSHLAEQSLSLMGTCCYPQPIHTQAVTDYSVIDPKQFPIMCSMIDPMITPANFQICGKKYEAITAALLGHPTSVGEIMEIAGIDTSSMVPEDHIAAVDSELARLRK